MSHDNSVNLSGWTCSQRVRVWAETAEKIRALARVIPDTDVSEYMSVVATRIISRISGVPEDHWMPLCFVPGETDVINLAWRDDFDVFHRYYEDVYSARDNQGRPVWGT